jgi:glyoxylase-like metal-dependent hydrolase (beta-lactamase superfamily II)
MTPTIHTYVSKEPTVKPNAFIVESDRELVIVDTTLTMSDSKALTQLAQSLKKPIAAVLLTHGHPDHVAGTANIAPSGHIPIYALRSVHDLMKASEQSKHEQWSALFKDEWVPKWVYPNTFVAPGDSVTIGGATFTVIDLGAGGDCDANSMWLLENQAAFVGDFVFNNNHAYMMDGSILRWIANLDRFEALLAKYPTLYVGHGPSSDSYLIRKQRQYFQTACVKLLDATSGSAQLSEESRKKYEAAMLAAFPTYGFTLTVAFSADAWLKSSSGSRTTSGDNRRRFGLAVCHGVAGYGGHRVCRRLGYGSRGYPASGRHLLFVSRHARDRPGVAKANLETSRRWSAGMWSCIMCFANFRTLGGALVAWPTSKGGCGSYSMVRSIAWAHSRPTISSAHRQREVNVGGSRRP